MKARLLKICRTASLAIMAICHGQMAMGQTTEIFDRRYPFIEQGQEPPGRYAPSEKVGGMLAWQGPSSWRTRHGGAIVYWDLGKPSKVENSRYPDNSRGEVRHTLDHGFRRPATGERLWIYGKIDIQPDDVSFIDSDQPVYLPPPQADVPNLEADLARDPAFLAAMKDERFAAAVLKVFDNRSFYKRDDDRAWICGTRRSAALVANLRDKGESYQDYFPGRTTLAGTYPEDRPDIERRLQSRIDEFAKSLAKEPPFAVRVEELAEWLGPGHHSVEEVRRVREMMRPQLEKRRPAEIAKYRERQQAMLEDAQRKLATFRENHTNDEVFEAVRSHLRRLGWRSETDQDRKRNHQKWVGQALLVLQDVKELERRPAVSPEAWAEPLRKRRSAWRSRPSPDEAGNMSADEIAVETGELDKRIEDLALTGRVSEQEYRALTKRSSRLP